MKNEALRLADELEMWTLGEPAAAELRRLHAQRDALLALVEKIRRWDMLDATADGVYWKREIDAAIKQAEVNT